MLKTPFKLSLIGNESYLQPCAEKCAAKTWLTLSLFQDHKTCFFVIGFAGVVEGLLNIENAKVLADEINSLTNQKK